LIRNNNRNKQYEKEENKQIIFVKTISFLYNTKLSTSECAV